MGVIKLGTSKKQILSNLEEELWQIWSYSDEDIRDDAQVRKYVEKRKAFLSRDFDSPEDIMKLYNKEFDEDYFFERI